MEKKPNYLIGAYLVSIGIIVGVMVLILIQLFTPQLKFKQRYNEIDYLMEVIKEYSYFYKSEELLKEGALEGIMESLEDPYSVYFSEEEFNRFNSDMNNDSVGAGIIVSINGPYPFITKVLENSPAEEAGLVRGQTIKKINDIDIKDKTYEEILNIIKGSKGDEREFEVFLDDETITEIVNLKLATLNNPTVTYEYFESNQKKIGFLRINIFGSTTENEVKNAMTYLELKNIEDLIIDVRDNPGGLLDSVAKVTDYFINSEQPFMYEQSRNDTKVPYYLLENPRNIDYNIAILINEHSASAAEVFAAAMNELGDYPLIGKTSFGKGTVQILVPINPKETKSIKLTTDRWLTPSGKWIHEIGLDPTIEVELTNHFDLSFINAVNPFEYDQVDIEIKDVQIFLNRLGYESRMDGYYDEKTVEAVKFYQEDHDLQVTGTIGMETAYQLNLDIINYVNNKENDNQYQKALEYLLDN